MATQRWVNRVAFVLDELRRDSVVKAELETEHVPARWAVGSSMSRNCAKAGLAGRFPQTTLPMTMRDGDWMDMLALMSDKGEVCKDLPLQLMKCPKQDVAGSSQFRGVG